MPGLISKALDFAFGSKPLKQAAGTAPAETPPPSSPRPKNTAGLDILGDAQKMADQKAAQSASDAAAAQAAAAAKKKKMQAQQTQQLNQQLMNPPAQPASTK